MAAASKSEGTSGKFSTIGCWAHVERRIQAVGNNAMAGQRHWDGQQFCRSFDDRRASFMLGEG